MEIFGNQLRFFLAENLQFTKAQSTFLGSCVVGEHSANDPPGCNFYPLNSRCMEVCAEFCAVFITLVFQVSLVGPPPVLKGAPSGARVCRGGPIHYIY